MANLISKVTTAAMDITFATEDCTPPGLDELDCSTDIIDTVQQMANVAGLISSATQNCGNINNACAVEVANTIADTTDLAEYLISSAADCAMAPFNCVVDVFEAINAVMSVAVDIDSALQNCNPTPVEDYTETNDWEDQYALQAAISNLGMGPAPMAERRLAESGAKRALLERIGGERKSWQHHVERAHQTLAAAQARNGIESARQKVGQTHMEHSVVEDLTAASVGVVLV